MNQSDRPGNRPLQYRGLLIAAFIFLLCIAIVILGCNHYFSNTATPTETMRTSQHYVDGKFQNTLPTTIMKDGKTWETFVKFLTGGSKDRVPAKPLPVVSMAGYGRIQPGTALRFAWLGHSSVLVELDGKRFLFDPVFSERASFLSWMGPKRFQQAPLTATDMPPLDAVILSHDHYDHLDKATIIPLIGKTGLFYVPLGLAAILEGWGVPKAKIVELDWWDERSAGGMTLVATPARHFSGRGLFDRFSTLWCSWTLIGRNGRIYFSGDTGMTPEFKDIGNKYGPFDVTFMKIGAFNDNWPDIHLNPEQALQANRDLGGRAFVPIHWGTFDLGLHSWYEPIERLVRTADADKAKVVVPKMGELVDADRYENSFWWRASMLEGAI
jgi:L-ascorbate metabolism protein UlaG (beta-lactamase superfamily)